MPTDTSPSPPGRLELAVVIPAWLPALDYGGPVSFWGDMAAELARRGHGVRVLTSDLGPKLGQRLAPGEEILDGVRVQRHPTPLRYGWAGIAPSFLVGAGRALEGCDIIQLVGYRDGFGPAAAAAGRKSQTPYLLQPMGMLRRAGRSGLKKWIFDALFGARMVRGASRLQAASRLEAAELGEEGVPEGRISLLPLGLHAPDPPGPAEVLAMRRRLGLDEGDTGVLFLGRINYRKGIELAAEAVARTSPDGVRLLLVGPDEGDGALERARSILGPAGDRLLVPGPLYGRDKWLALAACDLFVLPSPFAENFGIAAAEAMAMGTPALVSPACGVGDWIVEDSGRVLEREPDVWARVLSAVAEGRLHFDRERVRAAAAPLEVERLADGYLDLYREVLADRC